MLNNKNTIDKTLKKFILFLFLLLLSVMGCKSYVSLNLQKITIKDKTNPVHYFIGYPHKLNFEKVVLFIDGSGRFPASKDFGKGSEASLYGFSVVYPEKTYIQDSIKFFINNSRELRMFELKAVIDDLIKKGTQKILLLSESEGTMLAPEIAKLYHNKICGLISISGSVFPFKEDILFASENRIGQFENIPSKNYIENIFGEIKKQPNNIERVFLGHSYKFWNSYLYYNPINDLKQLSCPILYVNGEYDELDIKKQKNKIDSLRKSGINIKQIMYNGVGHKIGNKKKEMAKDILNWAKSNGIF